MVFMAAPMVERTGKEHDKKHDVRCKKCKAVLFKTRNVNGEPGQNFTFAVEIKCRKCGLLNKI